MPRPSHLDELEPILAADQLNRTNFDRLKTQTWSRGGVVPFVGSGLSAAYGFPTWRQALLDLAASAPSDEVLQLVRDALGLGNFEEAAQLLQRDLGEEHLYQTIESRFGGKVPSGPGNSAARLLVQTTSGIILTTNYDRVLETEFRSSAAFEGATWIFDTDEIMRAAREDRNLLVKLHGDAGDRNRLILTASQYSDHYGTLSPSTFDRKKHLPAFLTYILTSRTVLFLGCSLVNDRTVRVLQDVQKASRFYLNHFAILPRPTTELERNARSKFLAEIGIRPIWYRSERHDDIATILSSLTLREHRVSAKVARWLFSLSGAMLVGFAFVALSALAGLNCIARRNGAESILQGGRTACDLSAGRRFEGEWQYECVSSNGVFPHGGTAHGGTLVVEPACEDWGTAISIIGNREWLDTDEPPQRRDLVVQWKSTAGRLLSGSSLEYEYVTQDADGAHRGVTRISVVRTANDQSPVELTGTFERDAGTPGSLTGTIRLWK